MARTGSTGWTRRKRKRRKRNRPAAATLNRPLQRDQLRADNPKVVNRKNADSKAAVNNVSDPTTARKVAKVADLVRSRRNNLAANRSSKVSSRINSNVRNKVSAHSNRDKTTTDNNNRGSAHSNQMPRVHKGNNVRSRSSARRAEAGNRDSGHLGLRVSHPDNNRLRQNRTDP